MTLKYCGGDAHQAERVFGWGCHTVALGLAERHTGSLCLGAQAAHSGRHRWEDAHPQVAAALCHLAEAHAQQDPTLRTSMHNLTQLAGALRSFRQRPVPGRLTPCHWSRVPGQSAPTLLYWHTLLQLALAWRDAPLQRFPRPAEVSGRMEPSTEGFCCASCACSPCVRRRSGETCACLMSVSATTMGHNLWSRRRVTSRISEVCPKSYWPSRESYPDQTAS